MERNRVRPLLAVVAVFVPIAGAALAACSGGATQGSANTADASQGGDASPGPDGAGRDAGRDASTPVDARGDAPQTSGDAAVDGLQDAPAQADAGVDSGASDASDAAIDGCAVGSSGEPTDLSCAHLYSDWASKTVYADVVPYDPGLHLWSDGADKTRWIHLPAGQTIDTSDMDEWTFPIGTQIWKEFRLPLGGDGSAPTRIETRLLWKQTATYWYRTTYVWSPDGASSATEVIDGELDAGGIGYEVPTQDECNSCHNGRKDGVLGFEAVALSSPGATGLNMQALVAQNLLTAPPASPLVIPGNATESAALGWLHMNCGTSCHNRGFGEATFTGFFMRLDVATLASVQATDTYTTGWNQPTSGFEIVDAAATYRIHACDLAESCAYYRASQRAGVGGTGFGIQMPPIDTHKVDYADLATVAAWIEEGCDAGAAPDSGSVVDAGDGGG